MKRPSGHLLLLALTLARLVTAQTPAVMQKSVQQSATPPSERAGPAQSSGAALLESDHSINEAIMSFARTGDRDALRMTVFKDAQQGDLAAELLLGEQYIPEQCVYEPNQDVPHCGKNGDKTPPVVFRKNPLGIEASYEEAAKWLEKASAQGFGEASEVLAQLITRMQANGHATSYTEADAARFHALARSQNFDVELLDVTCYKLVPGRSGLTLGRLPGFIAGDPPKEPFTPDELRTLTKVGVSGSLLYGGGSGFGESALLVRPEGPAVRVRIILDHDPGVTVMLPTPAHHDQIYLQQGDRFLALPSGGQNLPRPIGLTPQTQDTPQVSVSIQHMDGASSAGFCTRFP